MKTLAAILVNTKKPLELDEIEIPKLKPGQVLIEIKYSGICHTQLLEVNGHRGEDKFLPHLLGHEGSGVVLETSSNVQKVKKGDHVILSWMKGSGANVAGSVYQWHGKDVNAGAITTFSKLSIISENRLTVIPKEFPLKEAALLGCAVPTGLGAVFNIAKPKPAQSIAIFGCGGVGLCAIQGAKISGCAPIIAIDINEKKLEDAKKLGATHTINASKENPIEQINSICKLDFAIEASGNSKAMQQAFYSVKDQGGQAIIIGNAHHGISVNLDPKHFNMGKNLLGTWGGNNNPDIHFSRYCNLVNYNLLNLNSLTNKIYNINQINQAIKDLENGLVNRPLVEMNNV
jgi:S-(hydroxymethyl)glutathione dehydrogenase/alcohol dehydrogenase